MTTPADTRAAYRIPKSGAHHCDERCVCPIHGTPLLYWPKGDDHACQDPDCRHAHGMDPDWWKDFRPQLGDTPGGLGGGRPVAEVGRKPARGRSGR